jgi:uncharacterized protein YwgA
MPKIDEINEDTDLAFLLFHYAEEVEGITKLQKLIFLLEEETEFNYFHEKVNIEFEPYKYGPFSEQVYDELELLLSMGVVEEVETEYELDDIRNKEDSSSHASKKFVLTERGQKAATEVNRALEDEVQTQFEEVIEEYTEMDLETLLEYVYRQYPSYTTESEIKKDILG